MTNQEIIEALKENEKPFVLLTPKQQMVIMKASRKDGLMYLQSGFKEKWSDIGAVDWNNEDNWYCSYRLRQDYEPESEIVECRIDGGCYIIENANGTTERKSLSEAINDTRFIGFKFGGGIISTSPICYYDGVDGEGIDRIYESDLLKKYEVLHATHVLFQKGLDK